jgi:phospholipid/cholesterol/gamma-HCH transport system permease protein
MAHYLELNRRIFYWLFIGPLTGRMFKLSEVFRQIVRIGVQAIPMACLTAFTIGLTLAMQSARELGRLGADAYVPDLVAVTLLRELGPLLVATIVIGRSGSAVTAELGTMAVSEEIEALSTMAINPIRFLIIPRFLAMMIMLPVLTVFGHYVGMFGGWWICHFTLGMDTSSYILRAFDRAEFMDLFAGTSKSVVFAYIIVTVACHFGLTVKGGAEGVGLATTNSVVWSLISMLVANAILTGVYFFL